MPLKSAGRASATTCELGRVRSARPAAWISPRTFPPCCSQNSSIPCSISASAIICSLPHKDHEGCSVAAISSHGGDGRRPRTAALSGKPVAAFRTCKAAQALQPHRTLASHLPELRIALGPFVGNTDRSFELHQRSNWNADEYGLPTASHRAEDCGLLFRAWRNH